MSRYEIRIQEPSEHARQLGINFDLFVIWDTATNRRVPFGNYRNRSKALARIHRLEEPMTTDNLHPPANRRCQIYSEDTSVRCIKTGTHWEKWGGGCSCYGEICSVQDCALDFYSWECDGPHLYGRANSAAVPTQQEAA